jgi:hypothetical protein
MLINIGDPLQVNQLEEFEKKNLTTHNTPYFGPSKMFLTFKMTYIKVPQVPPINMKIEIVQSWRLLIANHMDQLFYLFVSFVG